MKFSKLSLAAGILLGITGLVSCGGVKPGPDRDAHATPLTACCVSDGSDCSEPQDRPEQDPSGKSKPGEIASQMGGCPSLPHGESVVTGQ